MPYKVEISEHEARDFIVESVVNKTQENLIGEPPASNQDMNEIQAAVASLSN